jgi:hypothetical protein
MAKYSLMNKRNYQEDAMEKKTSIESTNALHNEGALNLYEMLLKESTEKNKSLQVISASRDTHTLVHGE